MRRILGSAALAAAALAFSVAPHLMAQSEPKTGPAVGATFPEFTLAAQDGTQKSLASLLGPNGLYLVVYRSADW